MICKTYQKWLSLASKLLKTQCYDEKISNPIYFLISLLFVYNVIWFQQVAVVENKTKSKIKDDSRFQIFYKLRSSQVKENQEYFVATVSFL